MSGLKLPLYFKRVVSSWWHNIRIDKTAQVHPSVKIEPNIMENCTIGSNSDIGEGVEIGKETIIGRSVILTNCKIGSNVHIKHSASIGQDGFGWNIADEGSLHTKKPQLNSVIIEDHVEIGANTCIDRGSWRPTIIGAGTKIDNLVQIAHNVQIGRDCLICAQCGIAGSVTMGNRVFLGGQVGIKDHVTIGDKVRIFAKSGVSQNIGSNVDYAGYPAVPAAMWRQQVVYSRRLAKSSTPSQPSVDK